MQSRKYADDVSDSILSLVRFVDDRVTTSCAKFDCFSTARVTTTTEHSPDFERSGNSAFPTCAVYLRGHDCARVTRI